MFIKQYLKAIFILSMFAVLTGCGGGGGGSSSSAKVERATDPERLNVDSGNTVGFVDRNESKFFEFYATESTTYNITVDSVQGDVDIAVFNSDVLSEETIIVLSANPTYGSITQDSVIFTAPATQLFYIEIAAFLNSGFGQSDSVTFNIISNSEPVGSYSTTARIYAEQGDSTRYPAPNISIFKDITIDYNLFDIDAPSEVNHGQSYQFALVKPELDSNELGITMISGPTSMSLSNDGIINWAPHGPMFDTTLDVNWTLGLNYKLATYNFKTTTTVKDDLRQQPLFRSPISTPEWTYSADIADFDGDGINELLLTDNKKRVYTLEYQNNGFVHEWSLPFSLYEWNESPIPNASVQALTSADVNNDGNPDIIIGYPSKIIILDGVTKQQISSFEDGYAYRRAMMAADLTNSGNVTLVYLVKHTNSHFDTEMTLVAYDLSNLASPVNVWQSDRMTFYVDGLPEHESRLALGNIDDDANLEIISASGDIFDGESFTKQNSFPVVIDEDFIKFVDTIDIDGDGIQEIVTCCTNSQPNSIGLRSYSVPTGQYIWESPAIEPLNGGSTIALALEVSNIDATTEEEILVKVYDALYVYKVNNDTGLPELSWASSQVADAHTILVADIDNDSPKELITLSSQSHIVSEFSVFEFAPNALIRQWDKSPLDFAGSFVGGMWTKIAPGKREAVFINSDVNNEIYTRNTYLVSLSDLGLMSFSSPIGTNNLTQNAPLISHTDYDDDGIDEVFVSSADRVDRFLAAVDIGNDTIEWMSPRDLGEAMAVKYADMNNDSYDDLVVRINPPGNFNNLYVFDVVNNVTIGSFFVSGGDFEITASDNDDIFNIIFFGSGRIFIYEYARSTSELTFIQSGNGGIG
ncbi:FG-GAP-like repeat-containing protein, partial [Kaarinaea lacus]